MQSPTQDAAQASDAATPGASVAAVGGDRHTGSMFDTPGEGPPSPGQASPALHRSQEGRGSSSRRGQGSNLEMAAAVLAAADAAALAAAGPLSAPRLRVQGPDIILEDASSPKAPATAEPSSGKQQTGGAGQAAAAGGAGAAPAAAAAAANHVAQPAGQQQQAASAPAGQQQGQQPLAGLQLQQHHLVAAARASQSHELELQLRLASRTATGASNMALGSSRPTQAVNSGTHGDDRLWGQHGGGGGGGGGGDLGPSSSAPSAAVEGPVRMKYRSTLTEENVAYLNKLEQYTSRPDPTGRSSSDRIWRWLEGSGPPFDNPPPSLGVPSVTKGSTMAASNRRQADKRKGGGGWLSCFNCFGSGSTSAR